MVLIVEPKESLFTTSSGYTNYRGILNLCVILLVLSNARAALENIIKYGILVDPISWVSFLIDSPRHWPSLKICFLLNIPILFSLLIERLLSWIFFSVKKGKNISHVTRWFLYLCMFLNLFMLIAFPPLAIYLDDHTHPVTASGALMLVSIVFLKLVSYHMINFWCRDIKRPFQQQSPTTRSFLKMYQSPHESFVSKEEQQSIESTARMEIDKTHNSNESPANIGQNGLATPPATPPNNMKSSVKATRVDSDKHSDDGNARVKTCHMSMRSPDNETLERKLLCDQTTTYPRNLTLSNMYYFMIVPTLCYELEFARTPRIRKHFILKRLIEFVILLQLDLALVQQWIVPTVSNSLVPLRHMQWTHMLERLLKLAIPNHVIWLIWFYLFFHSLLNIAAELTRFADREFYQDWWNSESVNYFWSNWNIPVHKWCVRHLYVPLLALGWDRWQASTAVFFVSAFFHEYLVSVPLKLFRCWAFLGMLLQLPWARVVSMYFNKQYANVAVWISLIIGQPLCILMYYHDYYIINT